MCVCVCTVSEIAGLTSQFATQIVFVVTQN